MFTPAHYVVGKFNVGEPGPGYKKGQKLTSKFTKYYKTAGE